MPDLAANIKALCDRGARLCTAGGTGSNLDLPPEAGDALLKIVALCGETQQALRSRRMREVAQSRKQQGLAVGNPPRGMKVVNRGGVKVLEWDQAELRRIAEIARRVPVEGVAAVARDFWRRGVKDRRGQPWGKQKVRPFSRYRTPFASFYRAIRWFYRTGRRGLLPPPYDKLAESLPEPTTFGQDPRPKGWTTGGTARREQERAERKSRRKAAITGMRP